MRKLVLGIMLFGIGRVSAAEAASYFDSGHVTIVSSSHQDTGWMDTPGACRTFRIEHNIIPALEMMKKDPKYTFCMEATLHLMEFLEKYPERKDEVIQRMKEGRLEWGATYNQPYESWLSGEELVRQTYFGRRWIMKNLPGCDVKVAFNPDPPGRALQMQQILAKAGIPYMFISRYHEGLYRWQSPDGTGVLAYTPGHYGNPMSLLQLAPPNAVRGISAKLDEQSRYYAQRRIPPTYCLINSMDFSSPVDFNPLIKQWNAQPAAADGTRLPTMSYSSIRGFFEAIDQPSAKFDTLLGERPDVWIYITGPTHHELSSAKREAARLLPAAETFTTFASLLNGSFRDWPSKQFSDAWTDALYIDHGIGGKNGHITDEVFFSKTRNSRDTGRTLLDKALRAIAAQVKSEKTKGMPVTVFNDLSWSRSDVVELEIPAHFKTAVTIRDADGNLIPSQKTLLESPDEMNVASATMGAKATADSAFSPEYGAEKAIDGRWNVCDPNPETGSSAKWNSGANAGAHWLTVDFGTPRTVHKVVIRHEGVLGIHGGETRFNTPDFQIQAADALTGPWSDVVAPVSNNADSLTVHNFAPKTFRFLRVFITKGAQDDSFARIYEVQAFEKCPPVPKLLFIAKDVPPLGYRTYYMENGGQLPSEGSTSALLENDFFSIKLAPGGVQGIFDKQQGREMLDTKTFLGGEVFTMLSVAPDNREHGTDAGEFASVPLPVMDGSFDRVANHKPEWRLEESGPVRSVYQLEQPLTDATVRQRLIVWNTIKRLDCEVDLKNFSGKLWREFRMALPLAMEKPQLAYEVPFGVVQIGKDEIPTTGGLAHSNGTLNYFQQCRDIHPRCVQNFVDASDGRGGITMSSSVSVFDWIDPTTGNPAATVLQPVLLASRKSCHNAGNWYPQAGDHTFRFSLATHDGDWRNGRKPGIAANHPFHAVVGTEPVPGASLPASMGFAAVSADNVVVSTIKKAEDDEGIIVRMYDIEGKDAPVRLKLYKPLKKAWKTSIIEEDSSPLPARTDGVDLAVGHNAIETVKLK